MGAGTLDTGTFLSPIFEEQNDTELVHVPAAVEEVNADIDSIDQEIFTTFLNSDADDIVTMEFRSEVEGWGLRQQTNSSQAAIASPIHANIFDTSLDEDVSGKLLFKSAKPF